MTLLRLLALPLTAALSLVLSALWLALALWVGAESIPARSPMRRWRRLSRRWLSWDPTRPFRWAWHLGRERYQVVGPERQRVRMSADERARVVAYLLRRDGSNCQLCGWPVDLEADQSSPWAEEVDHIVPFSLGGECSITNFQLAHARCNRAKGARYYDQPGRAA